MLLAGCQMAPQRKWRKSLWNQKKKRGCSGGRLMLRATTRGQRRGKKGKNKTLGSCVSFRESTHTLLLLLLLQSLWFSAVNSSFRFFLFVVSLFFSGFFKTLRFRTQDGPFEASLPVLPPSGNNAASTDQDEQACVMYATCVCVCVSASVCV